MEEDIVAADWLCKKVRDNDNYAQNLYAALCNMRYQQFAVMPILKDEFWSCSWRYAGGLVAQIQGKGDYMDWYCSGMGGFSALDDETAEEAQQEFDAKKYVPEGTVTDEIREDLKKLGWIPSEWPEDE